MCGGVDIHCSPPNPPGKKVQPDTVLLFGYAGSSLRQLVKHVAVYNSLGYRQPGSRFCKESKNLANSLLAKSENLRGIVGFRRIPTISQREIYEIYVLYFSYFSLLRSIKI